MADTQIDKLTLDVEVKDSTSGESSQKKVNGLATAISRLDKIVKSIDLKQFSNQFQGMTTAIKPFLTEVKKASKELTALSKIKVDKNLTQALNDVKIKEGKTDIPITSGIEQTPIISGENAKQLKEISENAKKVDKEIKNIDKSSKKASKSASKLLKSFGRIAMYRAIRKVLSEITQAISETFKEIAKISPEFNQSMSQITSDIDKIKISLGVGLYQIFASLQPIISVLSNTIVAFGNSLSKVMAMLSGQSKYIKVNTEYLKDYKQAVQGILLPFDEFTTIGTKTEGIDWEQMLEEVDTPFDTDELTNIEKTLISIGNIIKKLMPIIKSLKPLIEPILQIAEKLLDLIVNILYALEPLIDIIIYLTDYALKHLSFEIDRLSPLILSIAEQFKGAFQTISGLLKILTGDFEGAWKSIGNGFANLVNGIANMFISLINFFIKSINKIISPISKISQFFGGKEIQIPTISTKMEWQPFANGGDFIKGTCMIAGESGAEIVGNTGGGSGAVMNMEQLRSAVFEGMIMAMAQNGKGETIINLDGNRLGTLIASSNGFAIEANRRNPELNWN